MKTEVMKIKTEHGAEFNVVFRHSPHYRNLPVVDFYDTAVLPTNHEPWQQYGQFVSGYYITTIAQHDLQCALQLYGGVPKWFVDVKSLRPVVRKCQELLDQFIEDAMDLVDAARVVLTSAEESGVDTGMGGPLSDLRSALEEFE